MTAGAGSTSQISLAVSGFFAGKRYGYGRINGLFLLGGVQNLAIGLGVVQYAISARKCLNQAMMF